MKGWRFLAFAFASALLYLGSPLVAWWTPMSILGAASLLVVETGRWRPYSDATSWMAALAMLTLGPLEFEATGAAFRIFGGVACLLVALYAPPEGRPSPPALWGLALVGAATVAILSLAWSPLFWAGEPGVRAWEPLTLPGAALRTALVLAGAFLLSTLAVAFESVRAFIVSRLRARGPREKAVAGGAP